MPQGLSLPCPPRPLCLPHPSFSCPDPNPVLCCFRYNRRRYKELFSCVENITRDHQHGGQVSTDPSTPGSHALRLTLIGGSSPDDIITIPKAIADYTVKLADKQ